MSTQMGKGDIFIVDDNPNNLNLLAGILREQNYNVRIANSGRRALVAVKASIPELIMLDINMPEMDGYEVCHQLKTDPAIADVPVIFISALDDVVDKVRAFQVGGVDYVTKPFQTGEVIARVESQLKIFRLQKELEKSKLELERQNEELRRTNEALVQAQKRTDLVFSALSDILPGMIIDKKYRLERKIGSGGFGAVFQATHLVLQRSVAVKIFRPLPGNSTPESLERFFIEGISGCRVSHPNAVAVLDSNVTPEGIAYLVMELLNGHTLAEEMEHSPVLSLRRCVEILMPVCSALASAHAVGVIHRDIKPDNIFLHTSADGEEQVKVVDFGIAKMMDESGCFGSNLSRADCSTMGTPLYMSPERIDGIDYDGKADVYSLGVMLYQMLTSKLPFDVDEKNIMAIVMMHLSEPPRPLRDIVPDIPEAVEKIVLQALAKNPEERLTAKELGEEFMRASEVFVDLSNLSALLDLEEMSLLGSDTGDFLANYEETEKS